jgi:hypothetical protein
MHFQEPRILLLRGPREVVVDAAGGRNIGIQERFVIQDRGIGLAPTSLGEVLPALIGSAACLPRVILLGWSVPKQVAHRT